MADVGMLPHWQMTLKSQNSVFSYLLNQYRLKLYTTVHIPTRPTSLSICRRICAQCAPMALHRLFFASPPVLETAVTKMSHHLTLAEAGWPLPYQGLTVNDTGLYLFCAPGVLQYRPAVLQSWSRIHSRSPKCLKDGDPLHRSGKNRRGQSIETIHELTRRAILGHVTPYPHPPDRMSPDV